MTDFLTLATAIASQLDGTMCQHDGTADGAPSGSDIAWINLANEREGLRVVLRRGYGAEATRLRASMSYTAAFRGDADYRELPAFYELETAAAMSRGADVIARQIESKIVQPAIPLRDAYLLKAAAKAVEVASLATAVARYQARFPTARIEHKPGDTSATFYLSRDSGYLSGEFNSDGRLYVSRISRMDEAAAFDLIVAVTKA